MQVKDNAAANSLESTSLAGNELANTLRLHIITALLTISVDFQS